jgi:purine-binding chemotaxis protein CheW
MPTIDYTMFTVIVVVVVKEKIMGLVVDAVSDVLNIERKDIQPPPQFGAKVDVSFVNGIGKSGDKLVALLDMDRLLSDGDLQEVTAAAAG